MEQTQQNERERMTEEERIEGARNFLCGYQLCVDMLNLRGDERKRAARFEDPCSCDDLLAGNEATWRARMFAVSALIGEMKNGREKLMLYYHYIRGESIEHTANLLDVSRRTGYRIHERGLRSFSFLYERMMRNRRL